MPHLDMYCMKDPVEWLEDIEKAKVRLNGSQSCHRWARALVSCPAESRWLLHTIKEIAMIKQCENHMKILIKCYLEWVLVPVSWPFIISQSITWIALNMQERARNGQQTAESSIINVSRN
jgi:hypothetical protein